MGEEIDDDPLVTFMKRNSPIGKWKREIITPVNEEITGNSKIKVGLHIHVYYPELLEEILFSLKVNTIKPDLFVTCNSKRDMNKIRENIDAYGATYQK